MHELQFEIRQIEKQILEKEQKIQSDISKGDYASVSKTIESIKSDLKYLSIIANGSPMEKRDNLKVMEFLRVHLEKLWELSIPA